MGEYERLCEQVYDRIFGDPEERLTPRLVEAIERAERLLQEVRPGQAVVLVPSWLMGEITVSWAIASMISPLGESLLHKGGTDANSAEAAHRPADDGGARRP